MCVFSAMNPELFKFFLSSSSNSKTSMHDPTSCSDVLRRQLINWYMSGDFNSQLPQFRSLYSSSSSPRMVQVTHSFPSHSSFSPPAHLSKVAGSISTCTSSSLSPPFALSLKNASSHSTTSVSFPRNSSSSPPIVIEETNPAPSHTSSSFYASVNLPVNVQSVKKTFICQFCLKSFKEIKYLKTHQKRSCSNVLPSHMCTTCGTTFKENRSLKRHIKLKHPSKSTSKTNTKPNLQCPHCSKSFNTKKSLKNHIALKHFIIEKFFKCINCNKRFMRMKQLILHYNSCHNKNLKYEKIIFGSEEDFNKWRKNIEFQNSTQFIQQIGKKKSGAKHYLYLHCNRSPRNTSIQTKIKLKCRAIKSQGLSKSKTKCTCHIYAKFLKGGRMC